VNLTEVLPAGIRTDAETVTVLKLLESSTFAPPFGAWPLSATVQSDVAPPVTDPGLNCTLARLGVVMVRLPTFVISPLAAVMDTVF